MLRGQRHYVRALALLLFYQRLGINALPMTAAMVSDPPAGATNSTEADALSNITQLLFQSQAQQFAYGWYTTLDPCGHSTCQPRGQPPCAWNGLSCSSWHVTGIQLQPLATNSTGPIELGGTISPYLVFLSQLRTLQLADLG